MIHRNPAPCKRILSFPIPLNCQHLFTGPQADDLAKFSYLLLIYSLAYEERREFNFYIPFPYALGYKYFGDRWSSLKKLTQTEYSQIFEWNTRYSNREVNAFSMSVRLSKAVRTGECVLYTTQKKYNPIHRFDKSKLDAVTSKLVEDFNKFYLPEEAPYFENPWQALSWDRVASRDFYVTRCDYGRVHTPFTSLKHRTLLRSDLGPLVALDVVCCQMLCLAAVVRKECGDHADLHKWLSICYTDDIYEYLADCLDVPRVQAKYGLIRCVFERTAQMQNMSEFKILEREFPFIAAGILAIKQKYTYEKVACECQKTESSVMVKKVIRRIKSIPLITVHDEYILPTKDVEHVQKIVEQEFRAIGINPRLKVTELGGTA